jgi:hypothetical protein
LMFDFNLWLLFFFSRDVDGKVSILVEKVLWSCRIDSKMQPDDEGDALWRGCLLL